MQEMTTVKEVKHLQDLKSTQVHRPFPPPVFDHLQYANIEGEGLEDLVKCSDVGSIPHVSILSLPHVNEASY